MSWTIFAALISNLMSALSYQRSFFNAESVIVPYS